ncbi:hypothetical protein [Bdellovibrio svalbardensis]|uniref:Uncharacterized protein n=1 Tax=Bdellovibrio svalbardensis TaxID=2972972 RepID=A0ABT6DMI5_9BACT|nr:hypothetical protein [Bdellovibrio svalbardensis]MDG0818081.1 hypothetical protein [Bdellovibrio svalbardensis]
MKSLIAALVLVASPAFAAYSSSPNEPELQYLSWCENNTVMGADAQGNVHVRYTCNEQQTCQTMSRYQIGRVIVIGTCVDNSK